MPKFAANLTMLFTELPFLDRFERAAKAGFEAVEFLFPYALRAEEIKAAARRQRPAAGAAQPARRRLGRRRARHRLPAGPRRRVPRRRRQGHRLRDAARRARSSTAWPARRRRGCRATRCCATTFVENLRFAAAELKKAGTQAADRADQHLRHPRASTCTAPRRRWRSSTRSAPTTPSCSTTSTTRSAWKASSPRRCRSTCARIGHVQLADNPGRNEPGTGEINYAFLFAHLDRIGYARLDRLRIQARHDHRGRARLAPAAGALTIAWTSRNEQDDVCFRPAQAGRNPPVEAIRRSGCDGYAAVADVQRSRPQYPLSPQM